MSADSAPTSSAAPSHPLRQRRKLSLHERYGLTCRNTGFENRLVLLLTYPSAALLPTHPFLAARIAELQRLFPLLSARVVGQSTREPVFERGAAWSAEQVLRQEAYVPATEGHDASRQDIEGLLDRETDPSRSVKPDEPEWSITLYTASRPSSPSAPGRALPPKAYLALASSHILTDGLGLTHLLSYLLLPDPALTALSLQPERFDALLLESTLPLEPRLGLLLPIVFRELVLPWFPAPLRRALCPASQWPSDPVTLAPTRASPRRRFVSLPQVVLEALKTVGKAHGVPRLHSIVWLAWLLALYTATPPVASANDSVASPWQTTTSAPRSERSTALGHSACTANYVSSYSTTAVLSSSDHFWALARRLDGDMHSSRGIQDARGIMGLLRYIPDPEPDATLAETTRPTGWEAFYMDKAASAHPFSQGLECSNLGRVQLPEGAEDICWTQRAMPFAGAVTVDVLGCDKGLRMSLTWREKSAISEHQIIETVQAWEKVVTALTEGKDDTVQALVA